MVTALKEFSCFVETMTNRYGWCDRKEVPCVRLWAWLREDFSECWTCRIPEGEVGLGERGIYVHAYEHPCTCIRLCM